MGRAPKSESYIMRASKSESPRRGSGCVKLNSSLAREAGAKRGDTVAGKRDFRSVLVMLGHKFRNFTAGRRPVFIIKRIFGIAPDGRPGSFSETDGPVVGDVSR